MVGKLKRLIAALLLRLTRYFSAVLSSADDAPDDVRVWVKSGHRVEALQCPLMTQIGNTGGRSAADVRRSAKIRNPHAPVVKRIARNQRILI